MATLVELTAQIVSAHAAASPMSQEQLLDELHKVHYALKSLEDGTSVVESSVPEQPKLSLKQAFKKDEVICLICNKGFTTLKRHLANAHNLKPGEYRKQFGIPSGQALVAKAYSEKRKQAALDRGLGDNLAKARAARKSEAQKTKASIPAVKAKPVVKAKVAATSKKVNPSAPSKAQVKQPRKKQ